MEKSLLPISALLNMEPSCPCELIFLQLPSAKYYIIRYLIISREELKKKTTELNYIVNYFKDDNLKMSTIW